MNILLFGPALSLLGVFAGSFITYHLTKRVNLQKDLSAARQEAYISFINAVSKSAINAQKGNAIKPDDEVMMHDAKTRICVYGSEAVIERLSSFISEFGVVNSVAAQEDFVGIISAMRSELMPSSIKIDENIITILFQKKQAR